MPSFALVILWAVASGQSTSPAPAFEISDVHASAPATNPDTFVSGGIMPGGRYDLRRATLLDLIGIAWDMDPDKVLGGPDWLGFDRFDISAKAPPSTTLATVKPMLRSLLAERFKLVVHKDTRPLPAFALTRGDGAPKLKEPDGSGRSGCQIQPGSTFSCHNMTMSALAAFVGRTAAAYLGEPVVDATGIEGSWDFDLKWDSRSRVLDAGSDRITIFAALEKQLGLKLEPRKFPVPVLVVDSVSEKPTPNVAGVIKALPPRSLEFDVAAVKLSPPDERFGFRRYPGGRLELHAFPMKMLIATAWDVDWDHMDERIAGAPKWIDSKRFNIVATSATGAATPQGSGTIDVSARKLEADALPGVIMPQGTGVIDEDFQFTLRSLLIDRFKLKTHYEDRPVPAWTLTALKPKLTKADPSNRSGCREAGAIAHDPRDVNPRLSRLIQCRNVTMAQFAQLLKSMDRVEAAFNDVADETGLKGHYDFAISFSPRSVLQKTAVQSSGGGDQAASEPNGAISFLDALRRQLGLNLEMHKRLMPVLMIDRIEETPTDN